MQLGLAQKGQAANARCKQSRGRGPGGSHLRRIQAVAFGGSATGEANESEVSEEGSFQDAVEELPATPPDANAPPLGANPGWVSSFQEEALPATPPDADEPPMGANPGWAA